MSVCVCRHVSEKCTCVSWVYSHIYTERPVENIWCVSFSFPLFSGDRFLTKPTARTTASQYSLANSNGSPFSFPHSASITDTHGHQLFTCVLWIWPWVLITAQKTFLSTVMSSSPQIYFLRQYVNLAIQPAKLAPRNCLFLPPQNWDSRHAKQQ